MRFQQCLPARTALLVRVCIALAIAALPGCNDPITTVLRPPSAAASARAADIHSRASLVWQDSVDVGTAGTPNLVPAGIRGDGRDKFGRAAPSSNEYQGNYCGVRAFIYDQRGEDGNLDPDTDTDYTSAMAPSCGSARTMAFYLGGPSAAPIVTGPHFFIDAMWKLGPGAVVVQPMNYGMQGTAGCRLYFDASYAGASNVLLSRRADVQVVNGAGQTVTARQWRVESQSTHMAACLVLKPNGKYADTGTRYYLPFAVTITQVPYPFSVYP